MMAAVSVVTGIWPDNRWAVIAATVACGIPMGVNNTLVRTAVMSIAPVPRPVASATYGFVRFIGGGGLAPCVAGRLAADFNVHVPFIVGAATVAIGAVVLSTVHRPLVAADAEETHLGPSQERRDAGAAVFEVPGLPDESILAEEALLDDAALHNGHLSYC
jgi:MFS family permease